jgi:tetratricopeptide (TPR) repeat protein
VRPLRAAEGLRAPARWLPPLLAAAALAAWWGSLAGEFVFDDRTWILEDPAIRSLSEPRRLLSGTSRPLLKASFAASYALSGFDPRGWHAANLAIHVLAGLALFGVLRRTLLAPVFQGRHAAAAPWLAGAAALLWLLHPLQTQAVTYLVQRGESLMGLCVLASLYGSLRSAQNGRRAAWGAAAVLASAAGMGVKEPAVVTPLLVWLHDRSFLAGSFAGALRARPWLYAGLATSWAVPFGWIGSETLLRGDFARPDLPTPGVLAYARTQPAVVLHYLRLAIWPQPLCFDYAWPPAQGLWEVLPAALALGALAGAGAWLFWKRRPLGFAAAACFLLLAPTSSVMPIQDLAVEHRMYLPLAPLLAAAVVALWAALARAGRAAPWLAGALVLLAAAGLGAATARRNLDYRDEAQLWASVIRAAPHNARAHYNLGTLLRRRGQLEPAIAAYRRSLELAPEEPQTHYNLANALTARGEVAAAVDHYRRALALDPGYGIAHLNLANRLQAQGEVGAALEHYRLALELLPGDARVPYNLGVVLEREGYRAEAIARYRRALELDPQHARARARLAALAAQGQGTLPAQARPEGPGGPP